MLKVALSFIVWLAGASVAFPCSLVRVPDFEIDDSIEETVSQQQPSSKRFGSLVGRVPRGRMPGVWGGTAVTILGPSVSNWTVTIPTLATTFRAPTAIYPMALRCLSRLGLCGVCPSTGSTGPHTTKTPSPSP